MLSVELPPDANLQRVVIGAANVVSGAERLQIGISQGVLRGHAGIGQRYRRNGSKGYLVLANYQRQVQTMVPDIVHLQRKSQRQLLLDAEVVLLDERHMALVVEGNADRVRIAGRTRCQSKARILQIGGRRDRNALRKRERLRHRGAEIVIADRVIEAGVGQLTAEVLEDGAVECAEGSTDNCLRSDAVS